MNVTQYIIIHLRKLGGVIISVMLNIRTLLHEVMRFIWNVYSILKMIPVFMLVRYHYSNTSDYEWLWCLKGKINYRILMSSNTNSTVGINHSENQEWTVLLHCLQNGRFVHIVKRLN